MENKPITSLQRFFNLLWIERQDITSVYLYAIFNGLINLSLPLGIQAIINLITSGQYSTSWIVLVVLVLLGIILGGVMQIMQLAIVENLQQKVFTRSAFEFAFRLPRLEVESANRYYMPELVNRFFDTLSVQKGLSKILIDFSAATLQVVFGLLLLCFYHSFFILFSLLLLLMVYFIFKVTWARGLKTSLAESRYKYEVAYWLEEVARVMETFKLAGGTPLPMEKTDEVVTGYLKSRKAHFKVLVWQFVSMVGFKILVAAGLLFIGGVLVINQQMNIGQFVAAEIIIILILSSVEKLIQTIEVLYDILTAVEKIAQVTDLPLENDTGLKLELEPGQKGLSLKIKDLRYQFEDAGHPVLTGLDLEIPRGQKLLLSGWSGSGKTLLLHMIAGLYHKYDGTIAYEGIPIGNLHMDHFRSRIGDFLAREDIFMGTILENITKGRPNISLQEVQVAARTVGLEAFITSLPEGYSTMLLPEGKRLPKSVRTKIMLARCLVGAPSLLLLEDPFQRLDTAEKERIIDYLVHPDRSWTLICVSNDPQVARHFDRIITLQEGKIMADGNFQTLSKEPWFDQIFCIPS